jgi:hypothetical protein
VNGFPNKLNLFRTSLEKSDLSHFPSCKDLAEALKDSGGSEFSTFASKTKNLLSEFNVHFFYFEAMKKDILLYNSPLNVATEEQPELCDLQANPFFMEMKENGKEFARNSSSK